MMEAETAFETVDCNSILIRLIAREDFIAQDISLVLVKKGLSQTWFVMT
jgi:hypothetical protein